MHLGQTASFLSEVLARPKPSVMMLSRLLREGGWVRKGPRGRNAPHVDAEELARFLIAMMACPDSPAIAIKRLRHFAALSLVDDRAKGKKFVDGLAILLDRLSKESWEDAIAKGWSVSLYLNLSTATISAKPQKDSGCTPEKHLFSEFLNGAEDDTPAKDCLPYLGGLATTSKIFGVALYQIAQVVLAEQQDPFDALLERYGNSLEKAAK